MFQIQKIWEPECMQQILVRPMLIIFNLPHMDNKSNLWLNKSYVRRQLKWWNAFSAETFTYICTKRWTLLRCDKIQPRVFCMHIKFHFSAESALLVSETRFSVRTPTGAAMPRGYCTWINGAARNLKFLHHCASARLLPPSWLLIGPWGCLFILRKSFE